MSESTQHKLDRIRPPRVQITYDVEIGDAIEKKELPLVVGILADLSGKPVSPPPKVRDRRFVEIDREILTMLDEAAVGYRLVLTKADKIKASELEKVTAAAFGQRRKMLRQSLKAVPGAVEATIRLGIDPQRRAETLSVTEFVALARELT